MRHPLSLPLNESDSFVTASIVSTIMSFRASLNTGPMTSENSGSFSDIIRIPEIRSGRVLGKYTFEEFHQLTQERGMVGEFSPYEFNIEKQ